MSEDSIRLITVLLIEDSPTDALIVAERLTDTGQEKFVIVHVGNLADGLLRLMRGGIDVIISDLGLPDSEGLAAVARLKAHAKGIPIIVLTGTCLEEAIAVDALRFGVQDYILKQEMTRHTLARAIRYAIQRKRIEENLARVNRELAAANQKLTTAQSELEKRVEARTEELGIANRDLQTMLYVATHDLKEPLNSNLALSRMLTEQHAAQLDEKGLDLLGRIARGSERMRRLLDDLLTLTRAQRIQIPDERISAEDVVNEALTRLGDRISETHAQVRIEKPFPRWRVHKTWAVEAIANLLSNALKFTRPGAPPEIEVGAYAGSKGIGVAVRDRGPGVPEEMREKIFQLFQRGVSRDIEGTGAGLAIVRQIAERHGGCAWTEPRSGGGSEFIATFCPPEPKTRALDLLLVDDDDDFVYILRETLTASGRVRHITVANDGVEALLYLRKANGYRNAVTPDVVLLDINMPRKNGFEVLDDMRHDPTLQKIPVAMVTSSAQKEDRIKSLACGASAYLTKPFEVEDLMEIVCRLAH